MAGFSQFYALLNQMPHADKEQLIFDASGGRTTSVKTLFENDYRNYLRLIANMQRTVDAMNNQTSNAKESEATEREKKRYRSMILSKLNERGIVVVNWDYSEVNAVIQTWTKSDKTMKTMSLDELKKLNRQVHKIMDWYDKKKEDSNRQSKLN